MTAPEPVDTTQFTGPGAIFALVLAFVRWDYWYADEDSRAFQTAKMFLDGGTCMHDGEVYDWGEWRDIVIDSLGINKAAFIEAVKAGRRR